MQGPILSNVDTSEADREEQAEKSRKRAARKAAAVRRMVRAKDRVSSHIHALMGIHLRPRNLRAAGSSSDDAR